MNSSGKITAWGVGLVLLLLAQGAFAAVTYVFYDDYDEEPTGSGVGHPQGYTFYGLGLEDWGVSDLQAASSPNSGYMALNNATTTWGAGLFKPLGGVSMTNGVLSVSLMRSVGQAGGVAFKVWDNQGNEFRTADIDLFAVGTTWNTYTQSIYQLTQREAGGSALNVSNITQVGLIFYKAPAGSDVITYYFDDFSGTGEAVPEPEVFGLVALGGMLCAMLRSARIHLQKK